MYDAEAAFCLWHPTDSVLRVGGSDRDASERKRQSWVIVSGLTGR